MRVLEFVEAALDDVAHGIDGGINGDLLISVALCGDHGEADFPFHVLADEVCIIALVGEQDFCGWTFLFHERAIALEVRDLAACESKTYREAQSIDAEMDIGRKATL